MPGGNHKHQLGWTGGEQKVTVVGSTTLIWANVSKELPDPAEASLRLWDQAFRVAKSQLDNDLQHFTAELQHAVAKQYGKGPAAEGDGSTGAWQLARLLQLVGEFLSLGDAAFQSSLPEVIKWLHTERASCSTSQARLKSLYSRLLFLLSRCSRLLVSEAEEQPSSTALTPSAAGAKTGNSTIARPGRLSLKLRQLLYGTQTKLSQQCNRASAGAAASAAASPSPVADSEDGQRQTEDEDTLPHRPLDSKKTRRKSALVSFQSPSGCEGRDESAAAVFPTYEKPQLHRMKRCNTMPVQQAEAMQQLLRQVEHSDKSDSSQPRACYPLRPSAEFTRADSHGMHAPQQHRSICASHPQQNTLFLQVSKGSHKRSMELSDFIAVQSAVHSAEVPEINWSSNVQGKQGVVTPACSPVPVHPHPGVDTARPSPKAAAAPGSLADFCDVQVRAELEAVDFLQLSGRLHVVAQQQQLLSGEGTETDKSPSASSGKSSKGWLRKQWSKMKSYAQGQKHGSKPGLPLSPLAAMGVTPAELVASRSSAAAVDSGSPVSSSKASWLSMPFMGSRQTSSFVGQPSKTVSGVAARPQLSSRSVVDATAGLLRQLRRPSAPAAAPSSQLVHAVASRPQAEVAIAAEVVVPVEELEPAQQQQQGVNLAAQAHNAARLPGIDLIQRQPSQEDQQQQYNGASAVQQHPKHRMQPASSPQRRSFDVCHMKSPTAAVAADVTSAWGQQRRLSPAQMASLTAAATAAAAQGLLQGPMIRSAPNSRSHSLDGGSRLGQLHALRGIRLPVSTALSSPSAVPTAAARAGWQHPMRLHGSRSSGQLSADVCASPVAAAAAAAAAFTGSWQQSPGGTSGSLNRSSSGLGMSRHGSSRLGSRAAAEPSRQSLQQQRQQSAAAAAHISPSSQPMMQLLQQQRQGSPAMPAVPPAAGGVWLDAACAGDAALRAAAVQQQLQQHRDPNALSAAAAGVAAAAGAAAAASMFASPISAGLPGPITPGSAAGYYSTRPASPGAALAAPYELSVTARQLSISRRQSVGGSLGSAGESEHGYCSTAASSGSGGYSSGTTTPGVQALYAAGMLRKGPLAAAAGALMGPMPGHRTCYYSDSGAVHIAAPASAALEARAALVALQARTIKCALCANEVLAVATKSHNDLCGMLTAELSKLNGSASTADARLTVLANWMEEQLMHCVWPEVLSGTVQQIIDVARLVASLQPDGTGTPEARCKKAIEQVDFVLAQWHAQMQALTLSESNAEVLAEGVADCDIVVTLCLRLNKQMHDKLKWLAEPLPGVTSCQASGATTPRTTAPVMQVSDFEMICPISRGAYGRVYKVKKKLTGDTFAIKVLTKTELVKKNMVESVTNERNILAMANNPFVVRFYYSFSSPEKLFLVMEYCPGGDLSSLLQHLGRFDEDTARQYIAETVLALEYCHSKGIIHRDLKPDNLLVSSTGHIKLSDFGLSKFGGAAAAEGAAAAAAGPLGRSPSDCAEAAGRSSSESACGSSKSTPLSAMASGSTPEAADDQQQVPSGTNAAAGSSEQQQQPARDAGDDHQHTPEGSLTPEYEAAHIVAGIEQLKAGMTRPPSLGTIAQAEAVAAVSQLSSSCSISVNQQQRHQQQQQQQQTGNSSAQEQAEIRSTALAPTYCNSTMGFKHATRKKPAQLIAAAAAAAALARVRGSSESYMSPASQAVKACQITRMIPHTSLPSSPAVFGPSGDCTGSGSAAVGRESGPWCLSPDTPAPMLQQLAADLHSGWDSGKSSSTGAGASADSGSREAGPAGELGQLQPACQGPRRDLMAHGGLNGSWGQETNNSRQCPGKQQQQDSGHHSTAGDPSLESPASAVADGSDPAAAITAEIADPVAVGQQTHGSSTCCAKQASWQHQLWQQQQASPVSGEQQLDHHWVLPRHPAVADNCRQASSSQLAEFVNAAAQQQVSIQRDGCDSSFSKCRHGSLQQPASAAPLVSRTMSAPVNAEQLQQRLQAVSDRLHLEEQQLLASCQHCGASSQRGAAAVTHAAADASIGAMAAEQQRQQQTEALPPNYIAGSAVTGSRMASTRASLQKSLSVALPPELQYPEDALQVCLRTDANTASQGNTIPSETDDVAPWMSTNSPDSLQQQQHEEEEEEKEGKQGHAAAVAGPHNQQQQQQQVEAESSNGSSSSIPQNAAQQCNTQKKLKHASQVTHRALGTPDYLAPERLIGMAYGPEVDWWALGVILYEFVYGAPPFNADTPQEIFERILDCNVEFVLDEDGEHVVSKECRDLIRLLLQGDPEKRLGHRGAGELKMHPWFQGVEWDTLARQKAAFVPLDNADVKDYFVEKPFSKLSIAADLQTCHLSPPKDSSTRPSKQDSGSLFGSAVARAPSSGLPHQLQHSLSYASNSSTTGGLSAADAVCAITPRSTSTTAAAAAGSGNSSASSMVLPAGAAVQQAAAGSWGPKAWTPATTPRSARGMGPTVAPAFVTPNGVVMCATPATPGSSGSSQQQQRQPAVMYTGGVSPAAFTSPVGVAALTVCSSIWQPATAQDGSPTQAKGPTGASAAPVAPVALTSRVLASSSSGILGPTISPRAATGGRSTGTTVDGQLLRRRCSASQVEQHLQQVKQRRWSLRQLGNSPGSSPFAYQQSDALAQAPLPPRQRRQSGPSSMNSPVAVANPVAASSGGGNSGGSSASGQLASAGSAALAAAGLARGSSAAYELRTWGSLYSSTGSSLGGAGSQSAGGAAAAAVLPPLPPGPQQQQQTVVESASSSPGATPGSSSTASPESADGDSLSPRQQQQMLLAMLPAGLPQDDPQQQEQQRKTRKSNCSSPQQRLKHQWAQQRLLHQLQQQQQQPEGAATGTSQQYITGCSSDNSSWSCLTSDAIVCLRPASDASSSCELPQQSEEPQHLVQARFNSSEDAVADAEAATVEFCDLDISPAAAAERTYSSLLDDANIACDRHAAADTSNSSSRCNSPEKLKAGRSSGSVTPPGWFTRIEAQSSKAELQLGTLSARSPPQSPRSPRGRARRRSAAAYTAAAAQAAAAAVVVMECRQVDVDWPKSPRVPVSSSSKGGDFHSATATGALQVAASLADWQGNDFRASMDDTGLHSSATFALDSCRHSWQNAAAAADVRSDSLSSGGDFAEAAGSVEDPAVIDAAEVDIAVLEMLPDEYPGALCKPVAAASAALHQQEQQQHFEVDCEDEQFCSESEQSGSPTCRCPFSFSTWQPSSNPPPSSAAVTGQHAFGLQGAELHQQQERPLHVASFADQVDSRRSSMQHTAATEGSSQSFLHSADSLSAFAAASDSAAARHAASRHDSIGSQGQSTAQIDDVDAFGDFVAVNVGALQELNIEKQHAEFLAPIQQAVHGSGDHSTAATTAAAAAAAAAAAEAAAGPGMAAIAAAQAEVQYHQMMLAQYAAAAAAAGATAPVIDHASAAGGLLVHDTHGSADAAAAAAHEQQWQYYQQRQMLHHQQYQQQQGYYEQFAGTAAAAVAGNASYGSDLRPGMYPDDEDDYDPILAQYGQGPPPTAAAAAADDGQQDMLHPAVVSAGGYLEEVAGVVHAVDAATGHLILLDAAGTQWMVRVDAPYLHEQQGVEHLQHLQPVLMHDGQQMLLMPYAMLMPDGSAVAYPYYHQQTVMHLQQQHYGLQMPECDMPSGYMSEPVPVLSHQHASDISAPVSAPLPEVHAAGSCTTSPGAAADITFADLVEAGLMVQDPTQRRSLCSDGSRTATPALRQQQQTADSSPGTLLAAVADRPESSSSSSRRCRHLRASLSTSYLDQLAAAARFSDPGSSCWHQHHHQQQHRPPRSNKRGSWSAREPQTLGLTEEEEQQNALYDALLQHGSSAAVAAPALMLHAQGVGQQQHVGGVAAQQLVMQQPATAAVRPGNAYTARPLAATYSEDGAVRMLSRGNSSSMGGAGAPRSRALGVSAAAAATVSTTRLSRHGSGSMPCLYPMDNPGAVSPGIVSAFAAAAEPPAAAAAVSGVLHGGLGLGGYPAVGKDFLAQLGAIATDGTRGYKYRASDSGHESSSFLQRAATASLPGTLSSAMASALGVSSGGGGSGSHRSTLSRTPILAP